MKKRLIMKRLKAAVRECFSDKNMDNAWFYYVAETKAKNLRASDIYKMQEEANARR